MRQQFLFCPKKYSGITLYHTYDSVFLSIWHIRIYENFFYQADLKCVPATDGHGWLKLVGAAKNQAYYPLSVSKISTIATF
jgi:hypothetical protein